MRKHPGFLRLISVCVLSVGLLVEPSGARSAGQEPSLPTAEVVEAFLARVFGYDPGVAWRILAIEPSEIPGVAHITVRFSDRGHATHLYVMPDGQHAVVGEAIPFGPSPFQPIRSKLEEGKGAARGPAKTEASISIVEFGDLQCSTCRLAHPVIARLLEDFPNVRFAFQQFPLPEHAWAVTAATYAECVRQADEDIFWKWLDLVYERQREIGSSNVEEKLAGYAAELGMDGEAVKSCAETPDALAAVRESVELGKALGVHATPTLFINGRRFTGIVSVPYEDLKALVRFEIEQGP